MENSKDGIKQESVSSGEGELPRDTIAQVYFSSQGNDEFVQKTKRRIDWIVDNVKGQSVLDAGCSEGVVPILLGRKSIKCVGIDINSDAISYANSLLLLESFRAQEFVRFYACGYQDYESSPEQFDTLIITEVIEHLQNPASMFDVCVPYLKSGGRLVLTTPFGYWPHHDHWQNVVFSELKEWLGPCVEPISLDVVDGYIRFIGEKVEKSHWHAFPSSRLLKVTEAAVVDVQKELRQKLEEVQSSRSRKKSKKNKQKFRELRREFSKYFESLMNVVFVGDIELPGLSRAQFLELKENLSSDESKLLRKIKSSAAFLSLKPVLSSKAVNRIQRRKRKNELALSFSVRRKTLQSALFPPAYKAQGENKSNLTVACIMDEFSFRSFEPECDLVQLDINVWKQQLLDLEPDFVLLESVWGGFENQWAQSMRQFLNSEQGSVLSDVIKFCKSKELKVVFWNKEDPPNFDQFVDVAKECDYIFTTDVNCIPKYKSVCQHENVYALQFAAQPKIHNPVRSRLQPLKDVCFAGSWYSGKHEERRKQLPLLLDACLDKGLDIFDRNFLQDIEGFLFPDKYQPFIRGSLTYEEVMSAYRSYKLFLNVDSVADSKTMFSRRVFEILACSTAVVSAPSLGVDSTFGDIVPQPKTTSETEVVVDRLLSDFVFRLKIAHKGYREVMKNHTYRQRLREVCTRIGVQEPDKEPSPKVVWAFAVKSGDDVSAILSDAGQQSFSSVVFLFISSVNIEDELVGRDKNLNVKYLEVGDRTAGDFKDKLALFLGQEEADYLIIGSSGTRFGCHYIADLLLPYSYTDACAVCKASYFVAGDEDGEFLLVNSHFQHRFYTGIVYDNFCLKASFFEKLDICIEGSRVRISLRPSEYGIEEIYSADPFNCFRYGVLDSGCEFDEVAVIEKRDESDLFVC